MRILISAVLCLEVSYTYKIQIWHGVMLMKLEPERKLSSWHEIIIYDAFQLMDIPKDTGQMESKIIYSEVDTILRLVH